MNLTNALRDRVSIQFRFAVQGALGETIIWTPVEMKHCRVIPLDVKAIAIYQQMQSEVTHKVVFRESVSLSIGNNRLLWKDKILEPVEPPQSVGNATVVMVKEV